MQGKNRGEEVYLARSEKVLSMDKIIIKDLTAHGILGLHDWERENPQDILINLVLFGDFAEAGASDDVEKSVNYQTVAEKVRTHAEKAGRLTVEALATDIAKLCLEDEAVKRVRVRVEKPTVIPFTKSVGVEIERERGDLGLNEPRYGCVS
ncbi:MAG: Dihydroneopterin aldolase [Chloroflexi bacterium]|nr:Dihydroneopterin aldolase [Chloroflexota bacterium]